MQGLSARSTRSLLWWALLLVVASAVALVLTSRAQAQTRAAEEVGDVALGSQLYALNCATCHASNGLGAEVGDTGRRAPPIRDNPQVTAAYVDLVLRTGRMPPAESPFDNRPREVAYDGEQRLAIVAFTIAEFGVENDLFEVEEGDPARGQQLWASNCAACHGSTGAGGVAGAGAWTPVVNIHEPTTIGEAIRVGPFQMPAFDSEQISAEGMADIAAFMAEVREEPSTPLGLVELNPVFASGFVALLAVVMLLSLLWISGKPTWFPDPDATPDDEAAAPQQPTTHPSAAEPAAEERSRE
jgi:ubiquinol-cytochrome c reductase cytochrome c subunit